MYVVITPDDISPPLAFGELLALLQRQYSAPVIGLRDPESGEDRISPPYGETASAENRLIYLASSLILPKSES
jgi:hypothetical protein